MLPLIRCASHQNLIEEAPSIIKAIEKNGFCIVDAWNTEASTLRAICLLLGDIQDHVRANTEGLVGEFEPSKSDTWKAYKSEYQSIGSSALPPHTDGAFLNGVAVIGNSLKRIGPPKFVVLQCIKHADKGGINLLVDSNQVLPDLLTDHPNAASILFSSGCIAFFRDDLFSLDPPVFQIVSSSELRIRFRFDSQIYTPAWSRDAVLILHECYHMNPKYILNVSLMSGQVLIMDNFRVLHGRTAFTDEKSLRRTRKAWIFDDSLPTLANLKGTPKDHRALVPFMPYGPISSPQSFKATKIRTGINFDASLKSRLNHLLSNKL